MPSNQVDLRNLSKTELRFNFEKLVVYERKITARLIEYIAEVERRRLFVDAGFSSMFDYLVSGLKYSRSSAFRRLQAARAFRSVPEVSDKIESGALKISQVAQLQSAIRNEEKHTRKKLSAEEKGALFSKIENKSQSETEIILDQEFQFPLSESIEKHRRDETVEITLKCSKEFFAELQRIKEIYSHINPGANWTDIVQQMAKDVLLKRDPLQKQQGPTHAPRPKIGSAAEPISRPVRRHILMRDQASCQFRNATGETCGSRYQIEIDHIKPRFAGGSNQPENLRALCRAHNQFRYKSGNGIN